MTSTELQFSSIFHRLWAMLFWKKKIKVVAQPTCEKLVWGLRLLCEHEKSVLAATKGWKYLLGSQT